MDIGAGSGSASVGVPSSESTDGVSRHGGRLRVEFVRGVQLEVPGPSRLSANGIYGSSVSVTVSVAVSSMAGNGSAFTLERHDDGR